jgi:hypothetical protein
MAARYPVVIAEIPALRYAKAEKAIIKKVSDPNLLARRCCIID